MRAVTDAGPAAPGTPMSEAVQNLFTILGAVSEPATVQYFRDKYNSCEIRYGDLKKQLADDICKLTLPIRERILAISADKQYLSKVAREGAEKARASASATLREVKQIMGFRPV